MFTKQEAYRLGYEHGSEMARESGSADAGCEGWDGMLINADSSFVKKNFGWDGIDSSSEAKELLAQYCQGAQHGAEEAIEGDNTVPESVDAFSYCTDSEHGEIVASSFDDACRKLLLMVPASAVEDGGWGWVEDKDGDRFEIGSVE
jgi:hypothetical protein